jgi:hypothetical protein
VTGGFNGAVNKMFEDNGHRVEPSRPTTSVQSTSEEANVRIGGALGVIVVIWLLVGVLAAWQRGYFGDSQMTCAQGADIGLTVLAGPLNYANVNPKVTCNIPQPSR